MCKTTHYPPSRKCHACPIMRDARIAPFQNFAYPLALSSEPRLPEAYPPFSELQTDNLRTTNLSRVPDMIFVSLIFSSQVDFCPEGGKGGGVIRLAPPPDPLAPHMHALHTHILNLRQRLQLARQLHIDAAFLHSIPPSLSLVTGAAWRLECGHIESSLSPALFLSRLCCWSRRAMQSERRVARGENHAVVRWGGIAFSSSWCYI
jgi:hypothetical protein